ncbi:MAG: UDP-N-acetylglucosamine 2-epimerase [Ilumatobacter fluminis]|uniref:UDP-N-acetylglucosamine 2-epimerase n=1 Tax=Ilumatobacter fluminis TaxID=467091 RepID=UPI0032EEC8D2
MSDPRRIAVATFGRSDFSILRPLVRLLLARPEFETGFWVGGAHFEQISGRTVTDIEASGLPIWARIDGGEHDRSGLGTADMMASQLAGFAAAASGIERPGVRLSGPTPDLVIVLGDRFEAVAAGLAMVPVGVPVAHISGGSVTEGAIDDVFRHCLTKVAALHFCDLPRFARRIHLMGEPPERIFTTGALGLDAFRTSEVHGVAQFAAQFGLAGLRPGYVLGTLHPESRRPDATLPMAEALVEAVLSTGLQAVFTYPNADPGSDQIIEVLEAANAAHDDLYCVRGFGADWFPSAMAHAGVMVGNSSGGIIEAASFGLPVVDIGDRQKGREHGPNVLHCRRDRAAILAAIHEATAPDFADRAQAANIYGDGRGAERVIAALLDVDFDALLEPKRFAEPDPDFVGDVQELPCG